MTELRITLTEDEVKLVLFLTKTLTRGGDPGMVTRHKSWASLCQKIQRLSGKAATAKETKQPASRYAKPVMLDRQDGRLFEGGVGKAFSLDPSTDG